jgi:hypothetical protein
MVVTAPPGFIGKQIGHLKLATVKQAKAFLLSYQSFNAQSG